MEEQEALANPKTYFQLICKVGSKGPYQRNVFLIFALNWFVSAFLLMGTSFLFMNPKFQCQQNGIQTDNCEQTICKMDKTQWNKYLEDPQVYSLATDHGPYLCDKQQQLNAMRMTLYIGNFLGYFVFLFITDNYGRKIALCITWATTMFGIFLLVISQSMALAMVGLFFAGSGCQAVLRINMAVLGQVIDYYKRQSYSVALQIAFGLAGVMLGGLYFLFRHWRPIMIFFCAIPGIVVLFLFIFYVEETPKFLVTRKGIEKTVKSLNRIAKINLNKNGVISQEDVKRVYENEQCGGNKFQIVITPLHLIKYKSLRKGTICCATIFFFMTYLYFGPVIIVDDLGISPFLAQVIVSLSELLAYPFAFCFIQKMPRVKSGIICYILSAICTTVLIFVVPPEQCDGCYQAIIQTVLIFTSRFIISFYFAIFFLYVTEIYPERVRGLGFGMASAVGAIASATGQFIFTQMEVRGINPMIFFTIFALICCVAIYFSDETLNKPLKTQIQQIQAMKNQEKAHQSTLHDDQNKGNSSQGSDGKDSHRNSLREDQKKVQMVAIESQSRDKQQDYAQENFQIG